jgi:DNA repair exonuclease SbcCD nuclease subunit
MMRTDINTHEGRTGTIVHAADLHLGAPLKTLGDRLGTEVGESLLRQSLMAFDNLIELTLSVKADILVLAGDIYDNAEYEVRSQIRMRTAMAKLVEAGVKVFIAHGNHDPLVTSFKAAAALPPEVTVFTPGEPQVHAVTLGSGHVVDVAGVSFGRQHEHDNLAQRFHSLSTDPRRTIAVLHTNVGSNSGHGDYAPCTTEDLQLAPVGYWALGHIHDRRVESMGPGRWWAYPGNLQGRSTKATECGPKGALVVPILSDGFGQPEFHACDTIRFLRADIDVTAARDVGETHDLIETHLREWVSDSEDRHVVARIRLTGASPAHQTLQQSSDLLAISREAITVAGTSVAKIEIATRPPIDRQQILDRDDLLADLLRSVDRITPNTETLTQLLTSEISATTRAALLKEMEADPGLAAELLQRVEQVLIELLEVNND